MELERAEARTVGRIKSLIGKSYIIDFCSYLMFMNYFTNYQTNDEFWKADKKND